MLEFMQSETPHPPRKRKSVGVTVAESRESVFLSPSFHSASKLSFFVLFFILNR